MTNAMAGPLSLAQYVRSQKNEDIYPLNPIANAWIEYPDMSIRRLCSLYEDGTVSIVDRCLNTRQILRSKFDIPITAVNPFLLLTLWTNTTREEQEAFIKRHKDIVKEAAWLL